jgi:large subunit ribosomal protein L21
MEYAIIESGGKQYKAVVGETIEVDRLPQEIGDKVVLDNVLLHRDEKTVNIGTPTLSNVQVKTTVIAQFKSPKVVVFKYKPKNRYRVKTGHRQRYTRLKIESIEVKKEKKARSTKKEETAEEATES